MRFAMLMCFSMLCGEALADGPSTYNVWYAKSVIAITACSANKANTPKPTPKPVACACEGTGRSGDGLGPCQCKPTCTCKKGASENTTPPEETTQGEPKVEPAKVEPPKIVQLATDPPVLIGIPGPPRVMRKTKRDLAKEYAAKGRSTRLLVFIQDSCNTCEPWMNKWFPKLRASGWDDGVEFTRSIQVINIDHDKLANAAFDIKATPTIIGVVDWEVGDKQITSSQVNSVWDMMALVGVKNTAPVTQAPATTTQTRLSASQLANIAAGYNGQLVTVDNNAYISHLVTEHGFTANQLNGLSVDQLLRLHSATHYGQATPFGTASAAASQTMVVPTNKTNWTWGNTNNNVRRSTIWRPFKR